MKTVLITITSYEAHKRKWLNQVIDAYKGFANYKCKIFISTNYTLEDNEVTNIPSGDAGPKHSWGLHKTLAQHYKQYDLMVSQDDDVMLTEANLDYYTQHQTLPMEYIPGLLVYEAAKGKRQIVSMPIMGQNPVQETLAIDGKTFIVPTKKHAACFIADKERYTKYLESGRGLEPKDKTKHGIQTASRTEIYDCGLFKKIVPVASIKDGSALVRHLLNKFATELQFEPIKYKTSESFA